jgi:A/G-specific adenine glycosylase
MSAPRATPLARALLRWYDAQRRDLPWRRAPSAYKTLVSEFMLQQTVVATVRPYFERFLRRFPDVRALAAASDDDVTALWAGLGYYARARNLRRAAVAVVERHGGEIPASEEALRALPGIGPYTAAAVAAIAFGARAFALDGNAVRVMARLAAETRAVDLPATRAALHARGLAEVPVRRAGDFAQAVMELGATVCARRPRCERCPVAALCAARAAGIAGELPKKRARPPRPAVRVACACITDGGRVLLVRRAAGLLAGTWALPAGEVAGEAGAQASAATARAVVREVGVRARSLALRGAVRHLFTHRDVTAEVFHVEAKAAARATPDRRWVLPEDLASLGVSSFTRKTLALGLGARP